MEALAFFVLTPLTAGIIQFFLSRSRLPRWAKWGPAVLVMLAGMVCFLGAVDCLPLPNTYWLDDGSFRLPRLLLWNAVLPARLVWPRGRGALFRGPVVGVKKASNGDPFKSVRKKGPVHVDRALSTHVPASGRYLSAKFI